MNDIDVVVGVDVGKSFHWLHATGRDGTVIETRRIDQDETVLIDAFTRLAAGGRHVQVVVDQPKNIGALTLACAARAGCQTGYLPPLVMRRAADMFGGTAKTDRRDAQAIAATARALPGSVRPVHIDEQRAELEALANFDHDCQIDQTRHINQLRALLAEVNPAFEKTVGEQASSVFVLALLQRYGGPWGMRDAGVSRVNRWAKTQTRVPQQLLDAMLGAATSMRYRPGGATIKEQVAIRRVAARIHELATIRHDNQTRIQAMLADNPTYRALVTMPGVGPATAAALVLYADPAMFCDQDHLASYAGLAGRTCQSGTSIHHQTPTRACNHALKNALYLSAFASLRPDPAARAYYDQKRAQGKTHPAALTALARKRLKIMYAIIRDTRPYQT